MIYKANDKYSTTLRTTWIYSPADGSLLVNAVPDNVPTIVVVGWGTEYETVFSVTGKSGSTPADYALTGVTRLRGYENNLAENLAVNCLNNEEFFNQYSEFVNDEYLQMEEQAIAPSTPASGFLRLYAASDSVWHVKDDTGTDSVLGEFYEPDAMGRQAIMNGNFDLWQRETSFTDPSDGAYTSDRWQHFHNSDSGTHPTRTITRREDSSVKSDIGNGSYSMRYTVDGAGSGYGNAAYVVVVQKIEYGVRYLCGESKKVTVSFWARSDITDKKLGIYLSQDYGSGGSPTSDEEINGETFDLTSSWVKYTHTFTTNTLSGKTFGTNSDDQLRFSFQYMWGSDHDTRVGASGAEDFVGAGYIDIAQVQLCTGETALPFQPKSYRQELSDCQRYCEVLGGTNFDTTAEVVGSGYASSTSATGIFIPFQVEKRTTPTLTLPTGVAGDNDYSLNGAGVAVNVDNSQIADANSKGKRGAKLTIVEVGGTSLTAGQSYLLRVLSADAPIIFDAEL